MKTWLLILFPVYLTLLIFFAFWSKKQNKSSSDFILGGSPLGLFVGFMTVAATIFSTFTLMGLPDFFRLHGIGAWIFVGVSDGAMVFGILWFAFHLRKKVALKGFNGMGGLLKSCYGTSWAGYIYFAGIFLFLIPYVAIQIRGISIFLEAAFPAALPSWGWAILIVALMLFYSETGGLKAIIYADVLQGTILLIAVWIIAATCMKSFGSISDMFVQVERMEPRLLSTPGPQGLFSVQFLIATFVVIQFYPSTQPQIVIRIAIMKDLKAAQRMAVALGGFMLLIFIPTIAIGLYGAVHYSDLSTADFLVQALLFDQLGWVAAVTIIGLIAAALSTSDSQIFALGTELRSLLMHRQKHVMLLTRLAIAFFAIASLVFSIVSSDQLVLLARVSFAGTALLGPMVMLAILTTGPPGREILVATAIAIVLFTMSLAGSIPEFIMGLRLDLLLMLTLSLVGVVSRWFR
ncbi:MAG: sodium:solute symporter family protein [Saprospiraceae bacterium]|nr:sodium:solute symporter family protein [Saprospiraceae bacterium]